MASLTQTEQRPIAGGVRRSKMPDQIAKYILLTLFTLTWLLPVFATLMTSFRTMDDITIHGFWSIPQTISLDKFGEAWKQAHIRQYLLNSFIITIPSLIGMLFFSSLSAYALALRGRNDAAFPDFAAARVPPDECAGDV
jgi:ABC-type glycerol-3-phosphate transport system permease component